MIGNMIGLIGHSLFLAALWVIAVCLSAPLAAAGGYLSGMLVAYFFPETFGHFETLTSLAAPQIGATLGFIGAFFRTTVSLR